jgi:hypothetical protein
MKPGDGGQPPRAQTGGSNPLHGAPSARTLWGLLRRWPTMAGVGLAGFIALDTSSGSELAPILAASGLVYLGAAALRKPSAAWPLFFGTVVVITAAKIGVAPFDATWVFLGLAALFVGYGLRHGAAHPIDGLPLQAIAMVGCGAAAAVALIVTGDVGAYVVAAGLLGHTACDVYHHGVNKVVVRSMAEFCGVLDTLLAVAMVMTAVRG